MSFTYTQDPTNNIVDHVRFLIGDTVREEHLIEDEEIQFALNEFGDNVNAACALICQAIAAKYAKRQDVRVSNYSTSQQSIYDKYLALANKFNAKSVSVTDFVVPSISKMEKQKNIDNDDAVQPFFKRDLFDNPETTQPPDKDSLT